MVLAGVIGLSLAGCHPGQEQGSAAPGAAGAPQEGRVTFNRDIAPIVYEHCTPCHRPGEAAPFPLITYEDVRSHAEQIAEVTASRFMPPWLPDSSVAQYAHPRRLEDSQIERIARWVEQGALQGRAEDLPPPPEFIPGWQLGEPDLVVTLPEPFPLPADGPDIYRNFVLPLPIDEPRWVRAIEVRPGNARVVHHIFVLTDPTRALRDEDAEDSEPGFPGMDARGAQSPAGYFIGWQPGRLPRKSPPGMAWALTPGTDLVLQVHLQMSGRPETVQPSVGLFFTDQRPTKFPLKICLRSTEIDIPAGEKEYWVRDEYTLPVSVDALAISGHAHYLGKKLYAYAELPDGSRTWLLKIDDWDINWQGDYEFARPVHLPKGSRIVQEFSYDNSAENIRNPFHPPRRVQYGLEATDEMAELWMQLLPPSRRDYEILIRDYGKKVLVEMQGRYRKRLQQDPQDVQAHIQLGKLALVFGQTADAQRLFEAARQIDPDSVQAIYYLGHLRLRQGDAKQAEELLEAAARLKPDFFLAQHDLGLLHLQAGQMLNAAYYFEKALEINAYDATALRNLATVYTRLEQYPRAVELLERAVAVAPNDLPLAQELQRVRSLLP